MEEDEEEEEEEEVIKDDDDNNKDENHIVEMGTVELISLYIYYKPKHTHLYLFGFLIPKVNHLRELCLPHFFRAHHKEGGSPLPAV